VADIFVSTPTARYPIVVGNKIEKSLKQIVKQQATSGRIFLISDSRFFALHGETLLRALKGTAPRIEQFVLPSGEKYKQQKTVDSLYQFLLAAKITRADFLLAAGGGVTTDIVGYVASTIMRGVKWGAVPTTLLGMVDAAIGGKTGINHAAGKNLIGTIWHPSFVHCDQQYLQTLPIRELVTGYGEILKYAGLAGEPMFSRVSRLLDGKVSAKDWTTAIRESARFKAAIVSKDERESNIRAYLNLGHTFGHAIEKTLGYGKLLHGEAVTVGLLGTVCLSMVADPKSAKQLKDYYRLVLSSTEMIPKHKLNAKEILEAMSMDKKRVNQSIRFVLLKKPGKPYLIDSMPVEMIRFAIEQMIADYSDYGGKHAPRTGR
jgi:3-dehydroquinate synthase